ncbi:MAG: cation-translocating P-type ATPase [Flavisolibacter sp.]|nr:cation-translocating P-type ATPase [Flavisolibacter sp.]
MKQHQDMDNLKGLTEKEVPLLQRQYGKNLFTNKHSFRFVQAIVSTVKEPMFLILTVACASYFILGQRSEGLMMLAAIVFVTAISLYQEGRSSKALRALQDLTAPKVMVIRDGTRVLISSDDLVPGDVMLLEEGAKVPADAFILNANDLSVNESIITGESLPVDKSTNTFIYQGTTINSGKCYAQVTATGNRTELGKIGKAVADIKQPKTRLQQQTDKLVQNLALFGFIGFAVIFFVNYWHSREIVTSILLGLTLAMAAIPEEIPVAFSSFMALGAYHMARHGIITRQPQTVEHLGAVSVVCLDKTGTITENNMQVKIIYAFPQAYLIEADKPKQLNEHEQRLAKDILFYATLASEQQPFDAMEKAILQCYEAFEENQVRQWKMSFEYPLQGQPPMMTHVYTISNMTIAAAKGATERILKVCRLPDDVVLKVNEQVHALAAKGHRVIGVASAVHLEGDLPQHQDDFNWKFEGLLALYDPPKKNIAPVFKKLSAAKIKLKLLTGDYPETAINIARETGMLQEQHYISGKQVGNMQEGELEQVVQTTHVFARMYPSAKLKVVNALKTNGEVVAMIGDGVNDSPALKAAHIGIAMGMGGTEMAREAADLIFTDDNLAHLTSAIHQGRKVYTNLKKAIRYIISIHIPIILTASLPLLFGWVYPTIFTPIHVIFLELIMGPTCSIFYEKEPVTADVMRQPPQNRSTGLFSRQETFISILQGLMITGGILGLYYFFMHQSTGLQKTRTIVFTTFICANIFLTFVNRSFTETIVKTIRYKNPLAPVVVIISICFLTAILTIPYIRSLFGLTALSLLEFMICLGTAFFTVFWFEGYKSSLKEG